MVLQGIHEWVSVDPTPTTKNLATPSHKVEKIPWRNEGNG